MILVERSGLLVSDASLAELHAFAARVGCEAFRPGRTPHYDLGDARAIDRAVRAGARLVSAGEVRRRLLESGVWKAAEEFSESC